MYAILSHGCIQVRALPNKRAAVNLLTMYPNGKVILDPRSVTR